MKVALGTIDISDEHRKLIAARLGQDALATRGQVQRFIFDNGVLALDDLEREVEILAEMDIDNQ